ncbi:MAG TPA: FGGY family carbohydrate kinase [Oligoflexia bacterium]|nr:FGGY family carbohydrate kinase [Oligoflexia bacterium]
MLAAKTTLNSGARNTSSKSVRHVIGIDVGTQSLKAVVIDERMAIVASASESYDVEFPQPGWAEQNPLVWESAISKVITAVLKQSGLQAENIAALGIASQLDGCIPVDRNGRPLSNCLIWMDRRATTQSERVDPKLVRTKNGITADAGHMAAKISWFQENNPQTSVHCFHQPVSYLVARLTGEHVMDHAIASTTMLYSLEKRDYDSDLLKAFSIDRETLPRIDQAAARAGTLTLDAASWTGLSEGLPVAVGTGDDFSSVLGAGLTEPGQMICVLGTAEVVGALDTAPKNDALGLVETHPLTKDIFFIENPGWLSGGSLTWFQEIFGIDRVEMLDTLAAAAPAGSEGVIFLPALSGAMAPEWNANARGCFYGLTAAHHRGHMARAVLEGCAFAMNDVLQRLRALHVSIDSILLTGGGAKSVLWAQIRADITGLPVRISEVKDTSPLGAALCAAVASGLQPDLAAGSKLLRQVATEIKPNLALREVYDQAYSRYLSLFDALKPLFSPSSNEETHS